MITSSKIAANWIGTTIKRLIVALALWGILPASAATWLINVFGLRGRNHD